MKKIVINRNHIGFDLSDIAVFEYCKLKGTRCYFYDFDITIKGADNIFVRIDDVYKIKPIGNVLPKCYYTLINDYGAIFNDDYIIDDDIFSPTFIDRDDPDLIKIVETLGEKANSRFSILKIVEIPNGVDYYIDNCGGFESVHEEHRIWK